MRLGPLIVLSWAGLSGFLPACSTTGGGPSAMDGGAPGANGNGGGIQRATIVLTGDPASHVSQNEIDIEVDYDKYANPHSTPALNACLVEYNPSTKKNGVTGVTEIRCFASIDHTIEDAPDGGTVSKGASVAFHFDLKGIPTAPMTLGPSSPEIIDSYILVLDAHEWNGVMPADPADNSRLPPDFSLSVESVQLVPNAIPNIPMARYIIKGEGKISTVPSVGSPGTVSMAFKFF